MYVYSKSTKHIIAQTNNVQTGKSRNRQNPNIQKGRQKSKQAKIKNVKNSNRQKPK